MASVLISIENKVEVAAADVLDFLARSRVVQATVEPEAIAALAVLIGNINTTISTAKESAKAPWNLSLDGQTAYDLYAVWPALIRFMNSLGIRF